MRCDKCGNRIKDLFLLIGKNYVCRKCLMYKENVTKKEHACGKGEYKLDYKLTQEQETASQFILKKVKERKDCILSAVTGSGKTEIIYETIKYCVDNHFSIGIVIPRKDVVIELSARIKRDFKLASITSVYGGNTKDLYADIIVLTSHQLYRYNKYFDVIIIDEIDAFPFYNNKLLKQFLLRSKRGNIVYMSATVPQELLSEINDVYYLNKRYHGYKLDVPKVKYLWNFKIVENFIKEHINSIVLIYFPTIKLQLKYSKKLKIKHYLINSKVSNRKELLNIFHSLKSGVILTTLVLERGVTFKDSHVIVYKADHELFNYQNLVQISGRVGRKKDYPCGDILFLVDKKRQNVKSAIKFIKKCNE